MNAGTGANVAMSRAKRHAGAAVFERRKTRAYLRMPSAWIRARYLSTFFVFR